MFRHNPLEVQMAYKPIYSRMFLEKVHAWPTNLRDMAFRAAEHTCIDPDLDDYKRTYLTPYGQKHPTTDHQYTLYFLVISATEVFFAWINDPSCLHDTRNELTDPCLKEFKRLQGKSKIESFDVKFHKIVFEVHPDKNKPIRCRSRYLGNQITLNSGPYGGSNFIGHAFSCDEPNVDIAILHASLFLQNLYVVLSVGQIIFEFQFTKLGHQNEIDLLSQTYDGSQWQVIPDAEDFILRKK